MGGFRSFLRVFGLLATIAIAGQGAARGAVATGADATCSDALANDPVAAVAQTLSGDIDNLAAFYRTVAAKAPELGRACHWTVDFGLQGQLTAARELLALNRFGDADTVAEAALAAMPDTRSREAFEPRLIAVRAAVAGRRRDPGALAMLLARYDAALSAGGQPADTIEMMGGLRACLDRNDVWSACGNGAITFFYGQFKYVGGDLEHPIVEGQCAPGDAAAFLAAAARPPLRPIAEALRRRSRACRLEAEIRDLGAQWWLDINRLEPEAALRAAATAERLDGPLRELLASTEGFDSNNPLNRVQIFGLMQFVHMTTVRSLMFHKLETTAQALRVDALGDKAFEQIPPAITAAQTQLLNQESGYLHLDTFSLTAYSLAFGRPEETEIRARILWRLLARYRGFSDEDVPKLSVVREQLADDETLLILVHSPDGTGVLVTADRDKVVDFAELDLRAESQRMLVQFILEDVAKPPQADSRFHLTAAELLYIQYLCQSEKMGAKRRLLVAGDATAERIPLTLLARPKGACERRVIDPETWDDTVPLKELADVEWAGARFSIRFMPLMRKPEDARSSKARRGYLGIGAPTSAARRQSVVKPGEPPPPMIPRQAEVATAESELYASMAFFPKSERAVLHGPRAGEPMVRQALAEGNSRIIHFATHASDSGAGRRREPALFLSPPERETGRPDDDGRLTAGEVAGFDLTGAVVVLSACRTTAPGNQPGSGIFSGLVAGFFEAGATGVLATYWPIADEAASAIGPTIIGRLAGGMPAAQAIQEAQKAYLASVGDNPIRRHPYYWAAYVDTRPQPWVSR